MVSIWLTGRESGADGESGVANGTQIRISSAIRPPRSPLAATKKKAAEKATFQPCLWPHRIKALPDRFGGHGGHPSGRHPNAALSAQFRPTAAFFMNPS
jgi:hypothetical protein